MTIIVWKHTTHLFVKLEGKAKRVGKYIEVDIVHNSTTFCLDYI